MKSKKTLKFIIVLLVIIIFCSLVELVSRFYVHRLAEKLPVIKNTPEETFDTYAQGAALGLDFLTVQTLAAGQIYYYAPYTGVAVAPHYSFRLPDKNIDYTTNALGFRGSREVEMPKLKNVFRVFVLGGSTVMGQFNNEWTIPYYLEKELGGLNGKTIEVFNAGVGGGFSENELILLESKIIDLEPDAVIIFSGRNDLSYSIDPAWQNREVPYYRSLEKGLNGLLNKPTFSSIIFYNAKFLASKSAFLTLTLLKSRAVVSDNAPASSSTQKINPQAIVTYLDNLRIAKAVLDLHKIKSLIVFQPTLGYCKDSITGYEQGIVRGLKEIDKIPFWLDDVKETWPQVGRAVQAIGDSEFVKLADYSCAFKDYKNTAYLDSVHYSPAADDLLAVKLVSDLKMKLGLR